MVVIIAYLVAFLIIFYQTRRALQDDSVDEGCFSKNLMEMLYLVFTGGSYSDYPSVAIPFYIIATVLLCLILLNLIISIMGDTFGRIKDEYEFIEMREKLKMLLELADEEIFLKKARKMLGKALQRVICCLRRSPVIYPSDAEVNASKTELIGNFLLVVEELEEKTALTTTIEDLAQRMTAIESQLSMDTNSIMTKMTAMETEMTNILKGMRQEMTSMKAELSKSEK